MLSRLQFLVEGFFEWSAGAFKKAGLSPNGITVLSFFLAVIASILYAAGLSPRVLWFAAGVSLVLSGYFDALDGAMARRFLLVTKNAAASSPTVTTASKALTRVPVIEERLSPSPAIMPVQIPATTKSALVMFRMLYRDG